MLTRRWSNGNLHSLMMGMQNGTATLEDIMPVFFFLNKTKHITLTIQWGNHTPWYLPKEAENLYTHKNLHTDIYRCFLQNCQNVEVTKMSFNRWMSKLWYVQNMGYYSVLKTNELLRHEETWRNLKCTLLSERSQSEKATHCMSPTTWHAGKGKTIETIKEKISGCQESGKGQMIGAMQKIFKAVKRLCMWYYNYVWKVKVLVNYSCPSLCDPMDCSPPDSSVQGILLAGILEWVAMWPPGDLPDAGIEPVSRVFPALAGRCFTTSATWWEEGGIWNFCAQFFCKLKIALTNKLYFQKRPTR